MPRLKKALKILGVLFIAVLLVGVGFFVHVWYFKPFDINLFFARTAARSKRILTLREGDPGSGTSFGFGWSRDSRAAFVFGGHSGIDCRGEVRYRRLRIIYTLEDGQAWDLGPA